MKFRRFFKLILSGTLFVFSASLLFGEAVVKELSKKEAPLTVEVAKFQMAQLYLAEDPPPKNLRHKYPALKAADKAANQARRELSKMLAEHSLLKARLAEIDAMDATVVQKMKLKKPLFEEAWNHPDFKEAQEKFDALRVQALREEIKALKAEGYDELASKMEAVLNRVDGP